MNPILIRDALHFEDADPNRLTLLCGAMNAHLQKIEQDLGIEINLIGSQAQLKGDAVAVEIAKSVLSALYANTKVRKKNQQWLVPEIDLETVHLLLLEKKAQRKSKVPAQALYHEGKLVSIKTKKGVIKPRTANQAAYIAHILTHDITFGIGPAGTGKTYLAVAAAVDALEKQEVRRILLTRPAVEAGEKLGFLPGDLSQKVDPYLRPLYDALFEMLGFEKVEKLIEKSVIEIAPLAYMRGRTLNDAFIILDESQNTTNEQMKMFLTRIGFNSKAVITGDITQIDLPKHIQSGLKQAIEVLSDVDTLSFNFFESEDVVRHPVVAQIVNAYQSYENAHDNKYDRAY